MRQEPIAPDQCQIGDLVKPPFFYGQSEKPTQGSDPFASVAWERHSRALAKALQSPPPRFTPRAIARTLLHGHAALGSEHVSVYRMLKGLPDPVSILDVGGGCGENYVALTRATGRALDYTVVENAMNCLIGKSTGATFATEIPNRRFNIGVVIGTLQYLPDWRGFLRTLRDRCDNIVIARTPLRIDGPTFHTSQAICPQFGESAGRKAGVAAVTVISLDELRAEMGHCELIEDRHVADYSAHFSRLPAEFRGVAYRALSWRNARGAGAHPGEDRVHGSAALGVDRRAA